MLEKSLNRIKLPKQFIDLVLNVQLNRYNKVIVNKEFTEEYHVEDGIDQGEVWSPLLWRIFYDTLLSRLEEIKEEVGYTIETYKILDINKKKEERFKTIHNVSAFMDDTTLIGKNKESLEKMIEICHEFFDINDIKANVKKYELIKINSKQDDDLIIENEKITKVNSDEGNRFLGIWFRYDNRRKIYKKKLKT
ncbi:hypothetical protein RclHR1_00500032 [Rhizophagus clarus]|uniref:Retrovirus-related protein n=1 Tax=Rhizophagus clarus TaxID=94130 RepID=A0A2Z6RLG3_9GLOM|nr:hypothetical protein RclHR1_00500032 [Rhizophagus clarus]GES91139.1 retrovirus-related protein [Rhizophagus clarus]